MRQSLQPQVVSTRFAVQASEEGWMKSNKANARQIRHSDPLRGRLSSRPSEKSYLAEEISR